MHTHVARIFTAVAAGAALATLGAVSGCGTQAAGRPHPEAAAPGAARAPAVPGTQLWVQRYRSPGSGWDTASAIAVGRGGGTVYVTGASAGRSSGEDFVTLAYRAATGTRLWAARYNGPGNGSDQAMSLAVSPDGRTVYVTGPSAGKTSGEDFATVAYRAATGARLWVSRYTSPGSRYDAAASVVASPDGRTVFVTGTSTWAASGNDATTVAYDAATGAPRWAARYRGPDGATDGTGAAAVSRDGHTLYVTGSTSGTSRFFYDYLTVAYRTATGAQLWAARYNGPGRTSDGATSVAAGPDGRAVYVTGASTGRAPGTDYATIAYRATTGARLWVARYDGPGSHADFAKAVQVSPGGNRVFVTGVTGGEMGPAQDYGTVAYDAATGARLWAARYDASGRADGAIAMAVSPGGATVYVTGASTRKGSGADYTTIAYRAATGAQRWLRSYTGPGSRTDQAVAVAVSPGGSRLFVTGFITGAASHYDYATVAYRG